LIAIADGGGVVAIDHAVGPFDAKWQGVLPGIGVGFSTDADGGPRDLGVDALAGIVVENGGQNHGGKIAMQRVGSKGKRIGKIMTKGALTGEGERVVKIAIGRESISALVPHIMSNLSALREAIEESPQNVPLLLLYAQSCLEELSLPEARRVFERVLTLEGSSGEAQLGVARVLFLDGKTSEAVVRLQRLLQDEPEFAPAHIFLSRIYLSEENAEKAVEHYRHALLINKAMSDPALERELSLACGRGEVFERGAVVGEGPKKVRSLDEWLPSDGEGPGEEEFEEPGSLFYSEEEDLEEERSVGPRVYTLKDFRRPRKSFAEVGGLEGLKEDIRMKVVYPTKRPDLFRAYGKRTGGSMLLYGPPGCGKTLVARAIAGETQIPFFEVELHHVLELYAWGSERNVHQIFDLARAHAPSVVFIDELDGLASDRLDAPPTGGRTLVSQLLHELEQCSDENEGVFVIAATNAPWNLDAAFQRPGRFDRRVLVSLPSAEERMAIIELLKAGKPVGSTDLEWLVGETEGFSGADLRALFDLATEGALRVALREGKVMPLSDELLREALRQVQGSATGWKRRFDELGWSA
jgi:transitional endoplasmic reticulum ATPase